jgi:hypothetical protein
MKLEFSRSIFEKFSNRFREQPFSGSQVRPSAWTDGQTDRQTDRHDEGNIRFSEFCERA